MTKTIVFYGGNAQAARDRYQEEKPDTYQYVQADAWNGERLEGDEIAFMGDVDPGQRARIENEWGKFDNRQNIERSGPTSLGGVERTPASDRRNLNPATRVDDPNKVEADQLKKPGFAPKAEVRPEPGNQNPKPTGLNATTGLVSEKAKG